MESQKSKKPVFIRRAKGMPFDEFKKICIKRFREAGLLSEEKASSTNTNLPDEDQISWYNL